MPRHLLTPSPLLALWRGALSIVRGCSLLLRSAILYRGVAAVTAGPMHTSTGSGGGLGATSADAMSLGAASSDAISHGIDCACYYTENFYVRAPIEGHFNFKDADSFSLEHASLLGALTSPMRSELITALEVEAARRRSQGSLAAARKTRVASEYQPRHPELWTLDPKRWLSPDFVTLVEGARRGAAGWRWS